MLPIFSKQFVVLLLLFIVGHRNRVLYTFFQNPQFFGVLRIKPTKKAFFLMKDLDPLIHLRKLFPPGGAGQRAGDNFTTTAGKSSNDLEP